MNITEIDESGNVKPCETCGNPTPGFSHRCTDYLFMRIREIEEESALQEQRNHAQGYREGWVACGLAVAKELRDLTPTLRKAVEIAEAKKP